jgi:hypothetical protein
MLAFTMEFQVSLTQRGRRLLGRRLLHHVHIFVQLRYKQSSRLFTREKDTIGAAGPASISMFMAAPAHRSGLLRRLQIPNSASAVLPKFGSGDACAAVSLMWLIMRNNILTKDNLLKRGWHGDDTCHICGMKESVNHLLLNCSVARPVWSIRSSMWF